MKTLFDKIINFWKTGKNGKLILVIVTIVLLSCICCAGMLLFSNKLASSPTYQATRTAEVVITQTFEALPTETPLPTKTPIPSKTSIPSNTPRPTNTATPAPQPIILTGTGDMVVDVPKWDGPALLNITYTGNRNFAIWSYASNGEKIDLLVNTIGQYKGIRPIDFRSDESTVRLEIKASGAWEIHVLPLEYITQVHIPGTYESTSDDVIALVGGKPDLLTVDASTATRNFVVYSYGNYSDLLVNEIAPYTGTVVLSSDTIILEIIATGSWSIQITIK